MTANAFSLGCCVLSAGSSSPSVRLLRQHLFNLVLTFFCLLFWVSLPAASNTLSFLHSSVHQDITVGTKVGTCASSSSSSDLLFPARRLTGPTVHRFSLELVSRLLSSNGVTFHNETEDNQIKQQQQLITFLKEYSAHFTPLRQITLMFGYTSVTVRTSGLSRRSASLQSWNS